MNCRDIAELLPLYLSDELEMPRALEFSAHLRACPACALEVEQQRALDSLLRTSILAENVDSKQVENQVRRAIRSSVHRWMYTAAAIAAVLVLGIFGVRALFTPQTRPFYAAAVHDHRVEIVKGEPRRWLTERASIMRLAAGQGIASIALAGFAPAGYRLERGRLCRLNGQLFLHLVYGSAAGNFSVFLRRAAGVQSIDVESEEGEHVAGFARHQIIAVVVSEQSGDAVRRFATSAATTL